MNKKYNNGDIIYGFEILFRYKEKNEDGSLVDRTVLKCQKCGGTIVRSKCFEAAIKRAKCDCKNKSKQVKHHEKIVWNGQLYIKSDFARLHNISERTLHDRLNMGLTPDEAIQKSWIKQCRLCGKDFETGRLNKRFCSDECSMRYNKPLVEPRKITCVICGKDFYSKASKVMTCSDHCRRQRTTQLRNRRYRHLQKIGKFDESVTLENVFKKYNGICQICGKALSFDASVTGDEYPSVDHIIPLSKGGTHEWDNVQLLCRKCNYIKRDK